MSLVRVFLEGTSYSGLKYPIILLVAGWSVRLMGAMVSTNQLGKKYFFKPLAFCHFVIFSILIEYFHFQF